MKCSPKGEKSNHNRALPAKRELSPLCRARISLGLAVDAKPATSLALLLRREGLDRTGVPYLGLSRDQQAQELVAMYYRLNATERKAVSVDYLILAAGADPAHIWGCINEGQYRAVRVLVPISAVNVMCERALAPDGHHDRELLFKIANLFPV